MEEKEIQIGVTRARVSLVIKCCPSGPDASGLNNLALFRGVDDMVSSITINPVYSLGRKYIRFGDTTNCFRTRRV